MSTLPQKWIDIISTNIKAPWEGKAFTAVYFQARASLVDSSFNSERGSNQPCNINVTIYITYRAYLGSLGIIKKGKTL